MMPTLARFVGSLGAALTDAGHRLQRRGRVPDGMPGVRDQDNPCSQFYWGKPSNGCQTDGHYLCRKCFYADKARYEAETSPHASMASRDPK